MRPSRLTSLRNSLPQWAVFLLLLLVYARTLAPGLTWANGGSDGADLISAAAAGGVPHPTGYPVYLLLARLFQLIPAGSLAFRTNLLSAVATALAAALIAGLVMRSRTVALQAAAGMASGFAFGLAPLVWSQAVITEVYALQSLLLVLILRVYTMADERLSTTQLDVLRGLLLGLAVGNHVTSILLVPMALWVGSVRDRLKQEEGSSGLNPSPQNFKFDMRSLLRQSIGLGLGMAVYLILPLRALAHPAVNWGNVTTPERFWWLVSGQLYWNTFLQFSLPGAWERLQSFATLLLQQFSLAGVAVGLVGLVVYGSRSRLYLLTGWMALTHIAFAFLYRSVDSYLYLIPAFLCFAIWLGLGLAGLAHPSSRLGFMIILLFIGFLGARSLPVAREVDASRDTEAESFGREVLTAAPQDAILFARGDHAVFALWYFHFALGRRPDLIVIAEDLLHFDWYQENLRSRYPSLQLPGPFPWPQTIADANPQHAVCYVRYRTTTELNCP